MYLKRRKKKFIKCNKYYKKNIKIVKKINLHKAKKIFSFIPLTLVQCTRVNLKRFTF